VRLHHTAKFLAFAGEAEEETKDGHGRRKEQMTKSLAK